MKKLLVIITKPPYSREESFGAISFAGTGPAADVDTAVVFTGEGIYNAVKNQNSSDYLKVGENSYGAPNIEKLIRDMSEAGVSFYIINEDITKRGVKPDKLIESVKPISEDTYADLILEYDVSTVY